MSAVSEVESCVMRVIAAACSAHNRAVISVEGPKVRLPNPQEIVSCEHLIIDGNQEMGRFLFDGVAVVGWKVNDADSVPCRFTRVQGASLPS